jgi:hypothetical protein
VFSAAAAAVVVGGATTVNAAVGGPPAQTYSFFANTDVSRVAPDPEQTPVELGLRFRSSQDGQINAVRFLRAPGDTESHQVSLWSSDGTRIATETAPASADGATTAAWQQVNLRTPVTISAGRYYVVSYHTTRYMASPDYFGSPVTAGPLQGPAGINGVYAYGASAMPRQSWRSSNYWVDVVFTTQPVGPVDSATAQPSANPSASASPSASPVVSATPTPSSAPPAPTVLDLPRVPWDGGPSYYGRFPGTKAWTDPNFFPIGVWFESVITPDDVATDKAAGLNTYVQLTSNSNLSYVRNGGMSVIGGGAGAGPETVANLLTDEADMIYGPGWDKWTGIEGWNTCQPIQDAGGKCGYTVMKSFADGAPKDGRPLYANYGKGVAMWESEAEAATFVNQFQQLVSDDMYFYTDPNLCPGEAQMFLGIPPQLCRRSASYGKVIDRMRKLDGLDGQRQPVFGFVEDGHPMTGIGSLTIAPDQMAGAVMNSIIHEARGVIYFNHNFGGDCLSQHVLRDCGVNTVRPKAIETNARITALAPVLNTQSYQWTFNPNLDTMLKAQGSSFYIFAMPGQTGGTGNQTLTLPKGLGGTQAEVMFENRTLPVTNGTISDSFAQEYSYHIYKITP